MSIDVLHGGREHLPSTTDAGPGSSVLEACTWGLLALDGCGVCIENGPLSISQTS